MFEIVTPHRIFRTQIHTLREALPGVIDGLADSIHDARIATRRIREALPLLGDPKRRKHIEDLQSRFQRLGRSLGRVRDADVRVMLLASLETRIPHAAPALVVLRQQREQERLALVRKLIKKLERLDAVRLIEMLDEARLPVPGALAWSGRAGNGWRPRLRHTLHDRARATAEAIEHATGVYFPRRVHAARIAIKKLRYTLEIADATGAADRTAAIRALKKAQDVLGELHDRQDLIDDLTARAGAEAPAADQIPLLKQVIDAECHELHTRYLDRRNDLQRICASEFSHRAGRDARLLLAGGAAVVTSAIYAARRWPPLQ
jgi:CHAD domain-containing protein